MKPQTKILFAVGLVLFFAGSLLGIIFFAGLTWASLEANFYFGYNGGADAKLHLSCPHIITPLDSAVVTAAVTNKVDKAISPAVEAMLSGPIIQTTRLVPSIEPGQTQFLDWPVDTDNIAFGHLIMAQVYQYSSYKTGTAMATCGALYLNLPHLTGTEVYILLLVVSLVVAAAGFVLWLIATRSQPENARERLWGMVLLAVIVLLGLLFGTLGQWLLGTFLFFLSILVFIIQVSRRWMPS
jgi:hypothetical protein